jgi:hypothetical protein
MKPLPLRPGTRQGWSLCLFLFNAVLESRAIRQEKEINRIQIAKGEVKWSLFAVDVILYLRDCRSDQHLQQNSRIQTQCAKLSSCFIHQ